MKEKSRKLVAFLADIHLFWLVFMELWNLFAAGVTVRVVPSSHIYLSKLPKWGIYAIAIAWMLIGLGTAINLQRQKESRAAYVIAFVWNVVVPFGAGLFSILTEGYFYDYGDGFFSGLNGLVILFYGFAAMFVSFVAGVVSLICRVISVKRRGTERKPSALKKRLTDGLNLFTAAVFVALLVFVVCYLTDSATRSLVKAQEKRQMEEFTASLSQYPQEAIEQLRYDSYEALLTAQLYWEEGADEALWQEILQMPDMVQKVTEQFGVMLQTYEPQRMIEMVNSFMYLNAKDRTISCCFELYVMTRGEERSWEDLWCVVVFSENLEYREVVFTTQPPKEPD